MFPRLRQQIDTALDLVVEFSTLGEYRLDAHRAPRPTGAAPVTGATAAPATGGAGGDPAGGAPVPGAVAGGSVGCVPAATPAAGRRPCADPHAWRRPARRMRYGAAAQPEQPCLGSAAAGRD